MAYILEKIGNTYNLPKKYFTCDAKSDLDGINLLDVPIGSEAYCILEEESYILDSNKQWHKKKIGEDLTGQAQADWNQNDESAPDYVKNRPFYTGDIVETVLVEESTIEFFETGGSYGAEFQSTFEATAGDTYKVYWDGSAYECTCVDFPNGGLAMGNLSIPGVGSDTGEPFFVRVINGMGIMILTTDSSDSHTFSISGLTLEIVKVDEKYLPTIPADKLPMIPADKLPMIPVIEFTTSIWENIANATQPFFTVSNLSYSEIYSIVEKGNFQIKDSNGSKYNPIRSSIDSSGTVFVDILAFSATPTYAHLACSADTTMFYRNSWWQIEATQK